MKTIAVIGGTGNLGAALARRWAKAGLRWWSLDSFFSAPLL